jgi:hypothetical protein
VSSELSIHCPATLPKPANLQSQSQERRLARIRISLLLFLTAFLGIPFLYSNLLTYKLIDDK